MRERTLFSIWELVILGALPHELGFLFNFFQVCCFVHVHLIEITLF